jgi:hypothetical protein
MRRLTPTRMRSLRGGASGRWGGTCGRSGRSLATTTTLTRRRRGPRPARTWLDTCSSPGRQVTAGAALGAGRDETRAERVRCAAHEASAPVCGVDEPRSPWTDVGPRRGSGGRRCHRHPSSCGQPCATPPLDPRRAPGPAPPRQAPPPAPGSAHSQGGVRLQSAGSVHVCRSPRLPDTWALNREGKVREGWGG